MSIFLICLNYLCRLGNLLDMTYYLNNNVCYLNPALMVRVFEQRM